MNDGSRHDAALSIDKLPTIGAVHGVKDREQASKKPTAPGRPLLGGVYASSPEGPPSSTSCGGSHAGPAAEGSTEADKNKKQAPSLSIQLLYRRLVNVVSIPKKVQGFWGPFCPLTEVEFLLSKFQLPRDRQATR